MYLVTGKLKHGCDGAQCLWRVVRSIHTKFWSDVMSCSTEDSSIVSGFPSGAKESTRTASLAVPDCLSLSRPSSTVTTSCAASGTPVAFPVTTLMVSASLCPLRSMACSVSSTTCAPGTSFSWGIDVNLFSASMSVISQARTEENARRTLQGNRQAHHWGCREAACYTRIRSRGNCI